MHDGRYPVDQGIMLQPPQTPVVPLGPVRFARGGFAPVVVLAALFGAFAAASGVPVAPAILLGGVGGTASLIVHEMGHVSAARRVAGIRGASISLFWLGAATRMEGAYSSGLQQARVAIAGPAASFVLAVGLVPLVWFLPMGAKELVLLLILFNLAICMLNLVPAAPLDGHKVVHGLLWSAIGSASRARRWISRTAKVMVGIELPGALLLAAERPAVGAITLSVAAVILLQKPILRRLPLSGPR